MTADVVQEEERSPEPSRRRLPVFLPGRVPFAVGKAVAADERGIARNRSAEPAKAEPPELSDEPLNAPDAFHLALLPADNGFTQRPACIRRFFDRKLGFSETAVVFSIARLLARQRATDH